MKKTNKPLKVARIATVPLFFMVYKHHFERLANEVDITLICSPDNDFNKLDTFHVKNTIAINIPRDINPLEDLKALWKLYKVFRKERFDIVHSTTPKAGLLTAVAAFFAMVPTRLHTFTGQRWVTLKGIKRKILIFCDKIIALLNTYCYADSPSQVDFLISSSIISRNKIKCIHKGSFAGIDLNKFSLEKYQPLREEILQELNLSNKDFIITFVGRLVKDKGIFELVEAFKLLNKTYPDTKLLLVGPSEEKLDPLPPATNEEIKQNPNILSLGMKPDPEKYMSISSIFCLPSYREGFGSVILEAAAMKVPSLATDIVGLRDAIIENQTGILTEARQIDGLYKELEAIYKSPDKLSQLGENAYKRVIEDFEYKVIAQKVLQEYDRIHTNE